MYQWREPNKPIRAGYDYLNMVDDRSVCDIKFDGWRTEIGKFNGSLHHFSRQNGVQKLPEDLQEICNDLLPEGCELDVEWLNPTRIKAINTMYNSNLPQISVLSVFDVRWWNGKYLAQTPLGDRRALSIYSQFPSIQLEEILEGKIRIFRTPCVLGSQAKKFYNVQKKHLISEGMVIKKLNGGLNANWFKVKYRE